MNDKLNKMYEYFDEKKAECTANHKRLLSEDRGDEANFEKIRRNVYDVFKTVLEVAVKTRGNDPKAVKDFFLSRLETIPENWRKAYDKASEHGDEAAKYREELKLNALEDIADTFARVWEAEA